MNLHAFIVGSAVLLIKLYAEKYREDDLAVTLEELDKDDNLPRIKIYDFIIVGGGGAGCVLANRLSLDYKVLLLEAGGTPVPATRSQIFYDYVRTHHSIDYKFSTVPQQNVAQENGGTITQTEGKMLGGSTSHNQYLYNRGSPLIYNEWATILKDSSWEYKNILKYFKRSENYVSNSSSGERGHGGLMTVELNKSPLLPTWLRAGRELGFRTNTSPNSPLMEGFTAVEETKDDSGRRVSTYTAFIQPIEKKRTKLRIERYSHVSKVLLTKKKRAYGVAYTRHGIPQIAHASKEIIISCGTFGSPILLMKSGIGPAGTLREAGIPVVMDLPVGKTLRNNFLHRLKFSVNTTSLLPSFPADLSENDLIKYHKHENSILGYSTRLGQAFIVTSRNKKDGPSGNVPDIQLSVEGIRLPPPSTTSRSLLMKVALTRPNSIGCLSINTTAYKAGCRSSEQLALIDYKYLTEPTDADAFLEGIKLALATMESTKAFQDLGAKFEGTKHPGCSALKFRTDEYWRCHIRQIGEPSNHETGTCKMGFGLNDKTAVLDSKFKVLGISKLRVVDASAMPTTPNSNTAAPVIMLAEKAAHDILKTWKPSGGKFASVQSA